MNRREMLAGLGTVVAGGAALGGTTAFAKTDASLSAILATCIEKGEACIGHCISEMTKGNKGMPKCNQKVHDMVAVCKAMQSLVAYGSKDMAKELAAV